MIAPRQDSSASQVESWLSLEQRQGEQSVTCVPISSLSISDSPRLRGENAEHIRTLAATQVDLPPIIVHRSTMSVIDGVHRLRVAELRGQRTIAVKFFGGDDADAFILAVKSNIAHGLPLSLADRKYAARRIIASHPQWSDRLIATVTGLAAKTIADIRSSPAITATSPSARIGQDGRVRPIDATERRKAALQIIEENPSLSLREIARIVGISPETARDVRNRLRRGEDPLSRRQGRRHEHQNTAADHVGSGNRAGRDHVAQQERVVAIQRLTADPALRFSESGRALLRLLNMHTMSDDAWDNIIQNVPPHCQGAIVNVARGCAQLWMDFADKVERSSVPAPPGMTQHN